MIKENEINELISNSISNLESKHQKLEVARESCRKTLDEQTAYFKEVANKVVPVIKFLKENRYWFSHPDNPFATSSGAILAVTDDSVYCYTHGDLVVKHDRFDFDEFKSIFVDQALSEIGLSTAMAGLLNVLQVQEKTLNDVIGIQQAMVDDLESMKEI